MRTALYFLLALAVPAFAGQTVYKWVDEKGVTHFSDQPTAGAEKVELSSGPSRAAPAPTYSAPSSQDTPAEQGPVYSRFAIESPQQDEAVINTGGVVRVTVASSPALAGAHQISFYLDGSVVSDADPHSTTHEFKTMPRGTHTIKAVVSTIQGVKIQETPTVTFHVRQESAAQPPVGPSLRNSNKPKRTAGNKMRTEQPSYSALNGGPAKMDPRTNIPVVVAKPKPTPSGPKNDK